MSGSEQIVTELIVDASKTEAGVDAYEAALVRAGAATDGINAKLAETPGAIRQADAAYQSVLGSIDPVFAASTRLGDATGQVELAMRGLDRQVMTGAVTRDQYLQQFGQLKGRLDDVKTASAGLAAGTVSASDAMQTATGSLVQHDKATVGVAGSTRATTAIIREGTRAYLEMSAGMSPLEIAAANFGNIEHAAEKFGGAVKVAIEFLTSTTGLILIAGAAILAIGAAAESSESRMLGLQTALRGTRDDYTAMASEADKAARAVAQSGAATLADATAAATSLAAQARFHGTQAQLQDLITTANDLASVMGVTLPAEAKKLAAAIDEPGKAAEELANVHFRGMTFAIADTISRMQAAGDTSGAYAKYLDIVKAATTGAAQESKTNLQKALDDLRGAFVGAGKDGKGFADIAGKAIDNAGADSIKILADMIRDLKTLYEWFEAHPLQIGGASATGGVGLVPGLSVQDQINVLRGGGGNPFAPSPAASGPSGGTSVDYGAALQGLWSWVQGGGDGHMFGGTAPPAALTINDVLPLIMQYESGGQNVPNYRYDPTHTAQGYYQITNSTWGDVAPGVGAGQYPNAMSAPFDVQTAVASALLQQRGLQPWSTNQPLMNAVGSASAGGLPTNGTINFTIGGNAAVNLAANGLLGAPSSASGGLLGNISGPSPMYSAGGIATASTPAAGVLTDAEWAAQIDKDVHEIKNFVDANNLASDTAKKLSADLAHLASQGDTTSVAYQKLTAELNRQNAALHDALAPVALIIQGLKEQATNNDLLAAAWEKGAGAASDMQIQLKVQADLLKAGGPQLANNAMAVAVLTAAYENAARASEDAALAQKHTQSQDNLDYLNKEIETLGESADARARDLAVFKTMQDLKKDPHADEAFRQQAIDDAAKVADLTFAYQQQQQAIQTLGTMASSIFNTIGDQISQAFVSGQSAAITFGNITKAVLTQVVKDILQLAVIGPVMNSLLGTNATTLGQVLSIGSSALGGTGGGTTTDANGNVISTLSTGSSVLSGGSSLLQALGYQGLGGQINGLLGGPGTSLLASSSGNSIFSGIGGSVTSFLNTPIGTAPEVFMGVPDSFVAAAPSTIPGGAAGVGTLGGALGGIGGGFALGSLIGTGVQSLTNKTGPGPEIGAGVGAALGVAGAVLAPETFGVSLLLAGLAGGSIGKSAGGIIGRKKEE